VEREDEVLRRRNHQEQSGRDHRLPPWPPAVTGEPAEQRSDSFTGHDERPGARAVHRLLRDVRAQHEERRVGEQEVERDVDDEHPHPRLLDEGAPTLAELLEEPGAGAGDRHDPDLREEKCARRVRAGVDEQCRTRTDQGDNRAADGGTQWECRVAGHPEEPVRLLQHLFRHDLAHEPV